MVDGKSEKRECTLYDESQICHFTPSFTHVFGPHTDRFVGNSSFIGALDPTLSRMNSSPITCSTAEPFQGCFIAYSAEKQTWSC
jgi:hypothetical protein